MSAGLSVEDMQRQLQLFYSQVYRGNISYVLWAEARLQALREARFRARLNALLLEKRDMIAYFITQFSQADAVTAAGAGRGSGLCHHGADRWHALLQRLHARGAAGCQRAGRPGGLSSARLSSIEGARARAGPDICTRVPAGAARSRACRRAEHAAAAGRRSVHAAAGASRAAHREPGPRRDRDAVCGRGRRARHRHQRLFQRARRRQAHRARRRRQSFDLERILALHPDVVVVWGGGTSPTQLARIEAVGLRIYRHRLARLDDIASSLLRLGRLAGSEPQAQAAATQFTQRIAVLRARYRHAAPGDGADAGVGSTRSIPWAAPKS